MRFALFVRLVLLLAVATLGACGDSNNNKLGTTIKGERIAVMEAAKVLEADKNLDHVEPILPRMIVNKSWPQTGYDSVHAIPYVEIAARPQILWKADMGEGSSSDFKLLAHPVMAAGMVYTMDAQGLVRAFKASDGKRAWEFDTTPPSSDDKAIGGGLAVDAATLYATTGFGEVYALDAKTGVVKWRKPLLKPLRAAPVLADRRLYVVSIDNDLNALDAETGDILWHHAGITESATLMGASSPAVDSENVVVAYNSGEIYDLRAQNGRASWNYSLATAKQVGALPAIADIRGLPVADRGRIYAISHSGRMAAIDARSGDRAWESEVGGIDTPIIAGDTVFIYGGDSQILALSRENGRILWVQPMAKRADKDDKDSDHVVWTGPLLAGERLWMVNSLGILASFSPSDGKAIDTIDLGGAVYIAPIVVDHTMYVVRDDATLIALR